MTQTITRRDGVAEGLAYKRPVKCATTANITLSAEQTIDGILTSGNRVLVKNQTDNTQNGLYDTSTGAWTRCLDFDGSTDFVTGTQVYVQSGTVNGGLTFACTVSADPPVVGTSTITWANPLANGSVTNALLATAAAYTLKGNFTGATASVTDTTIGSLTSKATPAGTDLVIIQDQAAAGALKSATVASIGSAGSVSSVGGLTGAVTLGRGLDTTGNSVEVANSWVAGGESMINGSLVASVGTNILTVALKQYDGASDATATSPIVIPFRNVTLTSGNQIARTVTGALSITTNAVGATLGSTNGTPFRFWVVAFDNAGTVVLGLINCSTTTQTFTIDEGSLQSSTAMSAAATSVGVYYTPNGTTITSKPIRILGYVEYANGLTTAGTYDTAPTKVQLFGTGMPRPGQSIQRIITSESTADSTTSTTFVVSAHLQVSITPTSKINLIRVMAATNVASSANDFIFTQLSRGTVNNTNLIGVLAATGAGTQSAALPCYMYALDSPATTSAQIYAVQLKSNAGGTATVAASNRLSIIEAEELMG